MTADQLIQLLQLQPLPMEGGYYRETYRSADQLAAGALPARYGADKSAGTAIYYLLSPDTFSAMHRLPTDEIFHFYVGDPVEMLQLHEDGTGRIVTIGADVSAGEEPQVVVPRGVWQGSALRDGGKVALMGTTVAPAFDFPDFEAGPRQELCTRYPDFAERIRQLTREK